eukprot:TRINITY_DN3927_c0_g1_i2.p3 TRINITY_DN3927_c0_g1~~TRINITY_DN3927_c0_g1_i2.p3  ORF type:complete len:296 (-),score=10.35 TRINITY_DN3927_c0_g1_i2:1889-2776(-)
MLFKGYLLQIITIKEPSFEDSHQSLPYPTSTMKKDKRGEYEKMQDVPSGSTTNPESSTNIKGGISSSIGKIQEVYVEREKAKRKLQDLVGSLTDTEFNRPKQPKITAYYSKKKAAEEQVITIYQVKSYRLCIEIIDELLHKTVLLSALSGTRFDTNEMTYDTSTPKPVIRVKLSGALKKKVLKYIADNSMSLRRASRELKIPFSTLQRWATKAKNQSPGKSLKNKPKYSEQEQKIIRKFEEFRSLGLAVHDRDLKAWAESIWRLDYEFQETPQYCQQGQNRLVAEGAQRRCGTCQ